jgi:hypothetical protein
MSDRCSICYRDVDDGVACGECGGWDDAYEMGERKAVEAVVDYLRHVASGFALMRSVKANGSRDALYSVAKKLEKDYRACLGSRLAPPQPSSTDGEPK